MVDEEMARKLEEGQRVIATSDVLESLNGKWKMLIDGSPTLALWSNALPMPALMGKLDPGEIKGSPRDGERQGRRRLGKGNIWSHLSSRKTSHS